MRKFSFSGGIHPSEKKELSENCSIENVMPSSKRVVIPVTMGGAPNKCVVNVGDVVKKGQVIATGDGFMSVPVHASISGTVKKIGPVMVTANVEKVAVEIFANDSDEHEFMPVLNPFECDTETALKRIKDAGIVGMGGASFPAHVKFNVPKDSKIDTVILNAAECEPYLTIDSRTLIENADKVVDGLSIVMHITGGKGIIGLETNKKKCVEFIQKAIDEKNLSEKIQIKMIKTKYPQGSEKMLTKAILGREIPTKGLPSSIGCVICNVGTACAVSDAFRIGTPLVERPLTVSGGALENPKNIRVPIGTVLSDLVGDVLKVKNDEVAKIISGGPMMGFAMTNQTFPIEKGTSGILFLTEKETYLDEESSCIGCGSCIDSCPMKLAPSIMSRFINLCNYDKAVKFGLMDCIECGSCAYVCPSNIRLVQRFRLGKSAVRAKMAKEKQMAEQKSKNEKGGV